MSLIHSLLTPPDPPVAPGSSPPAPPDLIHSASAPLIVWGRDLEASTPAEAGWLWRGYLRPGNLTLLTSQGKCGKTTLVAMLLARLRTGGQLLGLPLAAGKALVVSEESAAQWRERHGK